MATTTNNGWETPDDTDLVKDGALAMRTLGNAIDTSTGKGLLAWQSYAPTLANGWANGNGTWSAFYCQIGKTVHVRAAFTFGSTTTKSANQMRISLPVNAHANAITATSSGFNYSVCAGSGLTPTYATIGGADFVSMNVPNAAGTYISRANLTSTIPATWATGDYIAMAITYEAA